MSDVDLDSSELYVSRELSWLAFNDRVLGQGRSEDVPLMERLKFLSIVSSNLDEFFMIRVAGLKQQSAAGLAVRDISGLTPNEHLERISASAHRIVAEQTATIVEVLAGLAEHDLRLCEMTELTAKQQKSLESFFLTELLPVLTPMSVRELDPFPVLPGLRLKLAVLLDDGDAPVPDDASPNIIVVPVPANFPRFVTVRAEEGLHLVPLEKILRQYIGHLFAGRHVLGVAFFRLTRDADVAVDADDAGDLMQAIESAVKARRRRAVVRLELSAGAHPEIRAWLVDWCRVVESDVYEIDGLLDAAALMDVATRPGFEKLKDPSWPPQPPADLAATEREDLWQLLQERDVMLFRPYEAFEPVVRLLEMAADDPNILAIKQTLYRTSGDSPIIAALARAAQQGKQVTVLVELKARFDEARNVDWARKLEDAGCNVIYGIAGLKTHAKAVLIVRRESHGIRRYVHLATGNYNDRTAKLYSDLDVMTTDRDVAADASAFFNLLTGTSEEVGWRQFAIAPTGLRQRFVRLIEREMQASTLDQPGLIMAKVNSLQDKDICKVLYRASRAGVKVLLNVRGICCLRPGIKDVSENIRVTSIVDRYLEHARIFYFRNGGHEEVYLSSADWMKRNLDRRLELLFPVLDAHLRGRCIHILETFFADNVKALAMQEDGTYEPVHRPGPRVRAQESFAREAEQAARPEDGARVTFRPLTRPTGPESP